MKIFGMFGLLLAALFISSFAFAQQHVPPCPCNTLALPDGTTGNEILEILCPGGQLGPDTQYSLESKDISNGIIVFNESVNFGTFMDPDGGNCSFGYEGDSPLGVRITGQQAIFCRARVFEACGLNINLIPTLSEWGMIAASGGFALIGVFFALRRRKSIAGA